MTSSNKILEISNYAMTVKNQKHKTNAIIGIYKITCIPNNRIYIGSSINIQMRWEKHRCGLNRQNHYNKHLLAAYNKYGECNFKWEIIEECSLDVLWDREQFYLNLFQPFDEKGFNVARNVKAPMVGRKHTLEVREKMSRIQKSFNKKCPEERKIYLSQLFKGRKRSQEAIEKGAAKIRGRSKSVEHKDNLRKSGTTPEAIKEKKERMERLWQERRNGRDCYICLVALWAVYNNYTLT